jgi:hypothetical protein
MPQGESEAPRLLRQRKNISPIMQNIHPRLLRKRSREKICPIRLVGLKGRGLRGQVPRGRPRRHLRENGKVQNPTRSEENPSHAPS